MRSCDEIDALWTREKEKVYFLSLTRTVPIDSEVRCSTSLSDEDMRF